MVKMKKLPDAEFDVMKIIWANEPPATTALIMEQLGKDKTWKIQTVISLMLRLVERGFLRSEKHGKERTYFPLINKDDYLKYETKNFIKHFHDNSFLNLVNTLYNDKALTDDDVDELLQWAKTRRG
ncbi:MAG: BlaI/MecI/CopY family transcriptional regulator [Treponema sp.]|jgi:predicted transcriptional regulator|nr:BlaI/MecI/CopY family transcriptional regulator [Treponema sp.]